MKLFHHSMLLAVLTLCSTTMSSPSIAQQPDRPRLHIEFQGPVGKTRALSFVGASNRLLAAGEGKVLELFDLNGRQVTLAGPGRWEFARGARGEINDVAVTPDGRFALIGGASARGSRDVVIMDLATRAVVGVLPVQPSGAPDSQAHGFSPILSVAVSPDSQFAASASRNGEVWLWDLSRGFQAATGKILRAADAVTSQFNPVHFISPSTLVYTLPTGPDRRGFRPVRYDLPSRQGFYIADTFDSEISAITSSLDGRHLAISSTSGQVTIRHQGPESAAVTIALDGMSVVRNVMMSPAGNMIAALGDGPDSRSSVLLFFDAQTLQQIDSTAFPEREACVAAAFSLDGRQFVTHDDRREFVLVWNLIDAAGNPIGQPLQQPPLAIGGRGQNYAFARFLQQKSTEATGYHVQLSTGEELHQFSLSDGEIEVVENSPVIDGNTFSGGWKLQFLQTNSIVNVAELTDPQGRPHRIEVDLKAQGELTQTHCFIPDAAGQPIAVALGTRTIDGIYVYSLQNLGPQSVGRQNLLRYFRDHSGEIVDLSVSADARYLMSTSRDKTIKLWSLTGLNGGPGQSIYGADFVTGVDGRIVATNVLKQGITFGRRIREGDHIVRVENLRVPEGGFTDPVRMLQILQSQSPFEEMYLWTARTGQRYQAGGDDDRIVMVPGWEPLLTLMMDKTQEWVMFTPEGFYNASPAEGHRLFGWQFNNGRDQTPRFETAASLQKEFEKPGIMRDILRLGSVADAVAAAGLPVPDDFQLSLSDRIRSLPEIQIVSPADNSQVAAGQSVTLQAKIQFPAGAQQNQFAVQADIGGRSLGAPAQVNQDGAVVSQWLLQPTDDINKLRVSVKELNGSVTRSLATDRTVTIRAGRVEPKERPRIYVVALGAEDYKHQPKLQFAIDDAEGVYETLRNHPDLNREFSGLSNVLTNESVTRETLQGKLKEILADVRKRKNPEDLIVLYITGHGVLGDGPNGETEVFYYLPPHVDNRNSQQLQQQGIDWAALTSQVNDAPCHVIWAIDACHAGAASDAAKKALDRDATGTGRRCVFLSTSGARELARENENALVRLTDKGHGWFTLAFLETLINSEVFPDVVPLQEKLMEDGVVTTTEMGKYIFGRVKKATDNNQRPVFTPTLIEPSTSTGHEISLLHRRQ